MCTSDYLVYEIVEDKYEFRIKKIETDKIYPQTQAYKSAKTAINVLKNKNVAGFVITKNGKIVFMIEGKV